MVVGCPPKSFRGPSSPEGFPMRLAGWKEPLGAGIQEGMQEQGSYAWRERAVALQEQSD